jgi:hypothetical protein
MVKMQLTKEIVDEKMLELNQLLLQAEDGVIWNSIDDKELQKLIENILKVFALKVQNSNNNVSVNIKSLAPITENSSISDTEVMLFVDKLLALMEIDLFEIQMFRSFCINN